ncbi:MAG: class A beta-lactamase-related serine hydrolase [Defluviitaleaceae bacterium]|nr:class A beta-lactamase-related serine hydrolase [Defluviitaleaceae bacterium]
MKHLAKVIVFIMVTLLGTAMLVLAQPEVYYIPLQYFTYDTYYQQNEEDEEDEEKRSISAYHEPYRPSVQHTNRAMGLFESRGATEYISLIPPQIVTVLDEDDRWLLISTYNGPMWIYLDFAPTTYHLEEALSRHGNRVSVFYMNLDTGFTFTYNPNRTHFSASVGKIYSALYIYTLAEREYITLDGVHTFTSANHRGGTGRIQHRPFGTQFTAAELLGYSMRYSDNVAYVMMAQHYNHPYFTFHDFVEEVGANSDMITSLTSKNIYLADAAIWMNAVHEYLESDGRYSEAFRNDLIATLSLIGSDNYDVASKYGWSGYAFHDAAIVYASSPYILIVLSDFGWEDPGVSFGHFARIGRLFEEFNDRYFR